MNGGEQENREERERGNSQADGRDGQREESGGIQRGESCGVRRC